MEFYSVQNIGSWAYIYTHWYVVCNLTCLNALRAQWRKQIQNSDIKLLRASLVSILFILYENFEFIDCSYSLSIVCMHRFKYGFSFYTVSLNSSFEIVKPGHSKTTHTSMPSYFFTASNLYTVCQTDFVYSQVRARTGIHSLWKEWSRPKKKWVNVVQHGCDVFVCVSSFYSIHFHALYMGHQPKPTRKKSVGTSNTHVSIHFTISGEHHQIKTTAQIYPLSSILYTTNKRFCQSSSE